MRYGISRPFPSGINDHFTNDDTGRVASHIVGFVKACEAIGLRVGMDCSVRLCDLKVEARRYLERLSMKFSGVGPPSMDVCIPTGGILLPAHAQCVREGRDRLSPSGCDHRYFAEKVSSVRQSNVSTDGLECRDFMRRCRGGAWPCAAKGRDRFRLLRRGRESRGYPS
ncbi:hypothetical protein [Pseudodesulfovibrio sp.]|uniref:hypothetical protein n=1 Tax=unclassified Pseudodesulfovibrio TaxID=2661612 RepID=UPI003AFFEDB6